MRVLVDTCVVIDAIQRREPFNREAEQIFLAAANLLFDGFVSVKSMTDIFYLSHRLTHDTARAKTILARIASIFGILDTRADDVMRAITSNTADFEDAVMIETAVREKVDCIVTRNTEDYRLSSVRVLTPAALIQMLTEYRSDDTE